MKMRKCKAYVIHIEGAKGVSSTSRKLYGRWRALRIVRYLQRRGVDAWYGVMEVRLAPHERLAT